MARARGANAQLLIKKELSYGVSPGGNFLKVPFVPQTKLGMTQELIEAPELGFGAAKLDPLQDVINAGGQLIAPVDLRNFGWWLSFLLGAADTDATAGLPYTHTWQGGGTGIVADLLSFAGEVGYRDIAKYFLNLGVCVGGMRIPFQRSGAAQATMRLIAQGENGVTGTSGGGTPTELTFTRFNQFQGSILKNGVALAGIVSGEINLDNGAEAVEVIRGDGKIDGVDPGQFSFTGNIVARFTDTTLYDEAKAGTPSEMSFRFIRSATESLTFTPHRVFLPVPEREIEGPGGISLTYNFQAALDQGGEDVMATVQLRNDVAAYA